MKQLTPQSMGTAWLGGMKNTRTKQRYTDGINQTQGNPMQQAAAQVDLWAQRVQDSKSKFVSKLQNVTVDQWKAAATAKADRLATGADTGNPKYQAQMAKWIPVYQQMHDAVQGMPKGTVQAAKDRSARAIDIIMAAAGRT